MADGGPDGRRRTEGQANEGELPDKRDEAGGNPEELVAGGRIGGSPPLAEER